MGLTLVTALYDLAGRERNPRRRTTDHYLEAAGFVIGLDVRLVVFADPDLAPELVRRRQEAGLAERTRVVSLPFEGLQAHRLVEQIAAAREAHPVENANPHKDTHRYVALQWSKFELLERAAELEPASSHLAWIDLGLPFRPHPDDRVFERPSDRVRLLRMRPWSPNEMADRGEYFRYMRGLVAGGYVSGAREPLLRVCELFGEEYRGALAAGLAPNDEQLLPLLCDAEPGLFEFHHGDYADILGNYERLRGGASNLAFQLRVARDAGLYARGLELCEAILASHRAGTLECSPAELANLLDECFLAAWYGGEGDRALAGEIADLYRERVAADPGFRDVYLREEIRVRSNFELLGTGPWNC